MSSLFRKNLTWKTMAGPGVAEIESVSGLWAPGGVATSGAGSRV